MTFHDATLASAGFPSSTSGRFFPISLEILLEEAVRKPSLRRFCRPSVAFEIADELFWLLG
jgi:hypothetical protein